jgi:hypothetical protein
MKKVMNIGMALVFVFCAAPAMAAGICPLKSALPDANTSIVQMTNSELSLVRGGWAWTFKNVSINYSSPSTTTSATAVSTGSGQVNNVSVNTGTESLTYDSQSTGGGFETLRIGFRPLRVIEASPPP